MLWKVRRTGTRLTGPRRPFSRGACTARKHVGSSLSSATFSLGASALNVEPRCPGIGGQSCSPAPRKLREWTPRGRGAGSWHLGPPPPTHRVPSPEGWGSVRPAEAGLGGGRRPQRFWKVRGPVATEGVGQAGRECARPDRRCVLP